MKSKASPIAVITDSTSDIPQAEAEARGIQIVPALLTIEGETYQDGRGISRSHFYRTLPTLSQPPLTAAPSPQSFTEAYEKAFKAGASRVLSIHISARLSGIINAASQAARAFRDGVHVFDSGQVSLGSGFQAMAAAEIALKGEPFEIVLDKARQARQKTRTIAMVDALAYLRRSGRVSWIKAGVGEIMRTKPLLEVMDGVVKRIGQVRTRSKAFEALIAYAEGWAPLSRLAILHTAAPLQAAALAHGVGHSYFEEPLIVETTTVIGAHVGPGAIGLIGLRK